MINRLRALKKGYSLVELLVSLGIISIIITIFFNSLIISLEASVQTVARSNLREEIANLTNIIIRDIRNSDVLISCENSNECRYINDGDFYSWSFCVDNPTQICKINEASGDILFRTSDDLAVSNFNFETGFGDLSLDRTRNNIVLTIFAAHSNENLEINNLVRQVTISTRNYEF